MTMGSKASMGGSGSKNVKVVGKVMSTQILTSLPKTSSTTNSTTTTTTTKPLAKGVVIDSGVGGSSSSKPPPLTEEMKSKVKGISTELTAEEERATMEKEMERQRQIQSILR